MPSKEKEKIAQKVTLEHTGGHIFMEGPVKIFLSHVAYSLLFFCFTTTFIITYSTTFTTTSSCNLSLLLEGGGGGK